LQLCYDRCSPYVYAIIKNYIDDPHSRKEVLQDSFISIFNSLHTYDDSKGLLKSWLSTITYRTCIKHLKAQKKLSIIVAYDQDRHEVIDDSLTNAISACSKAEVEAVLSKMPTGYRVVFIMNILDGLTHNEVATELGISAEASRSQLSRGLRWLRKNLSSQSKDLAYGKY
jgi:RNA polymerase sigma-70 factor (ECF subfamily)